MVKMAKFIFYIFSYNKTLKKKKKKATGPNCEKKALFLVAALL